MVIWEWLLISFIAVPMMIAWVYATIDIFRRGDIGGLATTTPSHHALLVSSVRM